MELVEDKRFPGSTPAREKPFKMYKDTKKITVRLTDLEEGWIFDKTSDPQVNVTFIPKEIFSDAQVASTAILIFRIS